MNTLFSLEIKTNLLYCNGNATLIRLIDTDSSFALELKDCLSRQDVLKLIRDFPNEVQIPPVGVIGPKEATDSQYQYAESLGIKLAKLGLCVICGGRNGAMEAVCKGVYKAGGKSIALLPGDHWQEANPYVTIPIVTNMGPTRNSLIAQTAFALIAVGGGYGTLTEMAYGLHYDKFVFATCDAPQIEGARYHADINTIITNICGILFGDISLSDTNTVP